MRHIASSPLYIYVQYSAAFSASNISLAIIYFNHYAIFLQIPSDSVVLSCHQSSSFRHRHTLLPAYILSFRYYLINRCPSQILSSLLHRHIITRKRSRVPESSRTMLCSICMKRVPTIIFRPLTILSSRLLPCTTRALQPSKSNNTENQHSVALGRKSNYTSNNTKLLVLFLKFSLYVSISTTRFFERLNGEGWNKARETAPTQES
jgi:hypothetical protein